MASSRVISRIMYGQVASIANLFIYLAILNDWKYATDT